MSAALSEPEMVDVVEAALGAGSFDRCTPSMRRTLAEVVAHYRATGSLETEHRPALRVAVTALAVDATNTLLGQPRLR